MCQNFKQRIGEGLRRDVQALGNGALVVSRQLGTTTQGERNREAAQRVLRRLIQHFRSGGEMRQKGLFGLSLFAAILIYLLINS